MLFCICIFPIFPEIFIKMERGRGQTENSLAIKYSANNYHVIYCLALLGASEKMMCDALGISQSAITYNKNNNPEFAQALYRGKVDANAKVAHAFFLNTQDRWVDDEQISVYRGEVIRIPYRRFIQGDKYAQLKWLGIKEPENWREVQTMNINKVNTNINLDLTGFSIEEAKQLEQLGYKQLPEHSV